MDIKQFKKMIKAQEKGSKIPAENIPFATGKLPVNEKVAEQDTGIGKKMTITGFARNAVLGAVVQKQGGSVFYIDGLSEWDENILGKQVEVTGILQKRPLAPPPVIDEDGGISHGMAGSANVMEGAIWSVV